MTLPIFKHSKRHILNISIYFILSILFFSCNAQEKHEDIINHLSFSRQYYFDNLDQIPFSSYLVNNLGHFKIMFFPITSELKSYYHNFEKNNNIKPIYSQSEDLYFYSQKQVIKISILLKRKINKLTDYKVIGIFVPIKYIHIDINNPEEYEILYPYHENIFLLNSDKTWRFIESKKIINYEQDSTTNTPSMHLKIK